MTFKNDSTLIDRRKFVELTAIGGGAILVSSLPGCGAGNRGADTASVRATGGFSQAGLTRLHDTMASYVTSGKMPGLVTLVSRRGQVEVDVIGNKALGSPDLMARDTIFRIASMTKPITAVAAMILVEESVLRLDESVERLLPELANRRVLRSVDGALGETVSAKRAITINDLLTFRMGFGLMFPMDTRPIQKRANELGVGIGPPQPQRAPAPNEWLRRFATLPLMSQPGEQWLYHTGAEILGILIARASGQDLETFFRERILDPLGMKDTSFSVPADKLDRLATSYWVNQQTGALEVYDAPRDSQWSRPPAFQSGGGGLVSTADDYLAFARMLLNNGEHAGKRILAARSVETMTRDHLTPEQKAVSGLFPGFFNDRGWGFGVSVLTKPDSLTTTPGRYGWDGGLGTTWFNDPAQDLIGILLTQRVIDAAWVGPVFQQAVYQAVAS